MFSSCGEDSPNIPEVPTPTPEVPTPSFHNIKFSGNGIVFEIISEGNSPNATYPFTIEGSNMFLDKNLNGVKDSGEEIADNFKGDLTLPKKDGKALFVLRGDVKKFEFNHYIKGKFYFDYPSYDKIKESKIDASKCATLKNVSVISFGLTSINLTDCKSLTDLDLSFNLLKTLNIKGLNSLETIRAMSNYELSGKYDFGACPKLNRIYLDNTKITAITLPVSKSCEELGLQNTPIESVDFSNGQNIKALHYGSDVSTSLDITHLNKLEALNLHSNDKLIKLIDKSAEKKTKLKSIILDSSPNLKDYDLTKYVELDYVSATDEIGVDMDTLISRLPNRSGKSEGVLELSKKDVEKVKNNPKLKEKNWGAQAEEQ